MPFRVPFPGIHSLARSDSSISTPISTLPMSMAARASSNWQCHKMDHVRQCWRSSLFGPVAGAGRLANTQHGPHTRTGCNRTRCRSALFFLLAPPPIPVGPARSLLCGLYLARGEVEVCHAQVRPHDYHWHYSRSSFCLS